MSGDGSPPPRRPTTMEDLPIDVHYDILKWVDEQNLNNVQRVCSLWHSIIDEWVGRKITTRGTTVILPNGLCQYGQGLELISQIGVRELEIRQSYPSTNELGDQSSPYYLKYPYLLTELDLRKEIHPDLFRSLTSGAVNLSMLHVTSPTIAALNLEDVEEFPFPKLKLLWMEWDWDYWGISIIDVSMLRNMKTLLKGNHFKWLATFKISLPFEALQDLDTFKVLFPFIQRHQTTLRRIFVTMYFPPYGSSTPSSFSPSLIKGEELKGIIKKIREDYHCCPLLGKISIAGHGWEQMPRTGPMSSFPQMEVWNEFLLKPSCVQELRLEFKFISSEALRHFCFRNGATLNKVVLSGMRTLDLSVLNGLQCLYVLSIYLIPEVSGTRELSPNLECLIMTNSPMREGELEHLLFRMPHLRHLRLSEVYNGQEGYGLKLETILELVKERRISNVQMTAFMGYGPFPEEGIPNGDPVKPVMLKAQDRSIHWMLNDKGYYVNTPRIFTRK